MGVLQDEVIYTSQPVDRHEPMPTHGDYYDPRPQMMVHDNNRGYHDPKQGKGKLFQNPEEMRNNGQPPVHEEPYDPLTVHGFNGPFAY